MPGTKKSGWAKIPFINGFCYLVHGMTYTEALKRMITLGGDTDTTAAIVGGLIGAADGYDGIPEHYRKKMLQCDPQLGKVKRPDFLVPKKCDLLAMITKLFNDRPDDSLIIN